MHSSDVAEAIQGLDEDQARAVIAVALARAYEAAGQRVADLETAIAVLRAKLDRLASEG